MILTEIRKKCDRYCTRVRFNEQNAIILNRAYNDQLPYCEDGKELFFCNDDIRLDGYRIDERLRQGFQYSYVIHNEYTANRFSGIVFLNSVLNKNIKIL